MTYFIEDGMQLPTKPLFNHPKTEQYKKAALRSLVGLALQYTSDGAAEPDNEQLPAYLYRDLQASVAEMLKL